MPDRLALIIEGLCHAVARRVGLGGLAGPLIILIWSRLRRIKARFAHAATSSPIPSRPATRRPSRPRRSPPLPLPRRKAWLLRLAPETASGASQLRHFLSDPEVATLLAADPRFGRVLRPLCHMLGIRATGIRAAGIRAAGNRPAQALPPPPSQPTVAAPTGEAPFRPIPSHAPPWQAAPQAAAAPPAAHPPWTTPPPWPDAAPPLPFQQRDALPEPIATPPALA